MSQIATRRPYGKWMTKDSMDFWSRSCFGIFEHWNASFRIPRQWSFFQLAPLLKRIKMNIPFLYQDLLTDEILGFTTTIDQQKHVQLWVLDKRLLPPLKCLVARCLWQERQKDFNQTRLTISWDPDLSTKLEDLQPAHQSYDIPLDSASISLDSHPKWANLPVIHHSYDSKWLTRVYSFTLLFVALFVSLRSQELLH